MKEHFSPAAWAGWQLGSLPPETAAAMRQHVQAGCPECASEPGFWALLSATLQHDREPVPAAWTAAALAQCRAGVPAAAAADDHRARLTFDNFVAPQPRSVRGLQARRHCVYELHEDAASGGSLELMTERLGRSQSVGDWSVVGQVLTAAGEGWRDCVLELTPAAGASAPLRMRSNAAGEFSFVPAGPGPWRLQVQAGHQHWNIAPVLMP